MTSRPTLDDLLTLCRKVDKLDENRIIKNVPFPLKHMALEFPILQDEPRPEIQEKLAQGNVQYLLRGLVARLAIACAHETEIPQHVFRLLQPPRTMEASTAAGLVSPYKNETRSDEIWCVKNPEYDSAPWEIWIGWQAEPVFEYTEHQSIVQKDNGNHGRILLMAAQVGTLRSGFVRRW